MSKTNFKNQFVVYYRVSTDKQDLDVQKRIIRNYLKEEWIAEEFEEVVSGKSMSTNPQLHEAVEYCRKYDKTLAAARHDRIGRDLAEAAEVAKKVNYKMFFPNIAGLGQKINPIVFAVMMGVAEAEREWIVERTRDAIRERIRQGKHIGKKGPWSEKDRKRIGNATRESAARKKYSDPTYKKLKEHVVRRVEEWEKQTGKSVNAHYRRNGLDIYEQIANELNDLGIQRPSYLGKRKEKPFTAKYISNVYRDAKFGKVQIEY